MGQAYVRVYGDVPKNGGDVLTRSGGSGVVSVTYFIHWSSAGFTGQGWHYIQKYLDDTGWPAFATENRLDNTYNAFATYAGSATELNEILGDNVWKAESKFNFVQEFEDALGDLNDGGCIETRFTTS